MASRESPLVWLSGMPATQELSTKYFGPREFNGVPDGVGGRVSTVFSLWPGCYKNARKCISVGLFGQRATNQVSANLST